MPRVKPIPGFQPPKITYVINSYLVRVKNAYLRGIYTNNKILPHRVAWCTERIGTNLVVRGHATWRDTKVNVCVNRGPQRWICPPGVNFVPWGWSYPLGVKFSVHPSILLNSRECSPLGLNRGVNITPRGQSSPLAAKFTPGARSEV
jgi:hypothetical protein